MIFNCPVSISSFSPHHEGWSTLDDFKLNIKFGTDDPPYTTDTAYSREWERGKGFWVKHFISVNINEPISLISNFGDWEFAFMLRVQGRALELAKTVTGRGHWQSEWFPEGDYSKQPNITI